MKIVGDRPIRINFDEGRIEIMSPKIRDGGDGYLLSRMVDKLTEELEVAVEHFDPVTLKHPDL